jgi:hypothetical protein
MVGSANHVAYAVSAVTLCFVHLLRLRELAVEVRREYLQSRTICNDELKRCAQTLGRLRIGLLASDQSWKKFQPFVAFARKQGVKLARFTCSAVSNPPLPVPFDMILQKKITDADSLFLEEHVMKGCTTRIVPPLSGTRRAQNRLEHLQRLSTLPAPYHVPKFVPVRVVINDLQSARGFLEESGLSLPLVCKPEAISSHEVYLVPDLAALCELEPPCILQEFVKHDALLFKVYVIGPTDITVCRRRSVRNDTSLEEVHFGRISKQKWTPDLVSSTGGGGGGGVGGGGGDGGFTVDTNGGKLQEQGNGSAFGGPDSWPSVADSLRGKVSPSLPEGYSMSHLLDLVKELSAADRFDGLGLFNFDLLFETGEPPPTPPPP